MRKPLALVLVITPVVVLLLLIYLVKTGRLSNPFENVAPDNEALSDVVGTINNFLGTATDEGQEKSIEERFAETGYPNQLLDFDPTQEQAVFGVVSSNPSDKTMVLRYIFPFTREGKVINSVIACPLSDSKIITLDLETGENKVSQAEKQLYEIVKVGSDTLQGICGDAECNSIVAGCELVR